MYHPIGFADSSHVVIQNGVPMFYYEGTTYTDKLLNNMKLEDKFEKDNITLVEEKIIPQIKEKNKMHSKYSINFYNNEFDYLHNSFKKKNKKSPFSFKKRQHSERKKTNVRKDGYSFKYFTQNENTCECILVNNVNYLEDENECEYECTFNDNNDVSDTDSCDSDWKTDYASYMLNRWSD